MAAPQPGPLDVSQQGEILVLKLNRPEKLNALDSATVDALLAALTAAQQSQPRLVVFRGEGKGFSGGFDFTGIDSQSEGDLALRFLRLEMLLQAVYSAPFITMALVHGPCFGAAADIAAACIHRIAAPGAQFRMPGLRFGVALGTRRLGELIGRQAAYGLLETSQVFDAETAHRLGFLTEIVQQEGWPLRVAQAADAAAMLSQSSQERLLRVMRNDGALETDLAELARSVAGPGLKQRMKDYLAGLGRS